MAGTVIDEAIIALKLDDHVTAEMAAAVAKAKAEAEELGHIRAKIKVDADTAKARAELEALKRELGDLSKMDESQAKVAKRRISDAEQELSRRQETARVMGLISRQAQRDIAAETVAEKTRGREVDATTRKEADAAKARAQYAKDQQKAYKMDEQRTRDLAKAQNDASKMDAKLTSDKEARLRSYAAAQDSAARMDARRAKEAEGQGLRDAQMAAKRARLQQQEITQRERVNELTKAYNRAQGSDRVRVSVDTLSAVRQLEETRAALDLIGAKPIEIKTKVETGGLIGKLKAMAGGTESFAGSGRGIRNLGQEIGSLGGKMDKARVNLFGLSIGLKSLVVGAAALSPVLLGLIGAIGSLIGVAGAGLGGAVGVGATALTGFGMAFVGILSNVKPFITGLTNAHKYTTTLDAALAKYGATSKQGKAAQAAFNREMKALPPTVGDTVKGFESLKQKWQGLTKGVADHNIANIVGSTFKTVRADMGFFAKDTNKSFTAISHGWSNIMSDFRSGSGKASLSNIFGKTATSLTPLMSAFRALAHVGTSVMSSFANFLPGLSKGFQQWAFNLSDSSDKSHGFAHGVQTMVTAMQSVGHFAQASGRLLLTFFKAAVGPGEGMLNDITNSFNKLSDSMNTVAGQKKLTNFFERGVQTTKELWNALLPLASAFVQFAQATAPVANIMLKIVAAFTKLVAFAVGFKPFQIILGGGAALALILKMTKGLREAGMLAFKLGKGLATFGTSMLFGGGWKNSWKNAFPGAATQGAAIEEAMAAGGATAGATMESSIVSGAAAGAAEFRAAMATGGAAAAAEQAAAGAATTGEQLAIPGLEAAALAPAAAVAPEIAGGTVAVEELGAGAAALAGPVGIAVAGLVGLGVALSLMSGETDQAKRAEKDLADTRHIAGQVRGINRTVSALPSIRQTGSAAVTALPSDQKSVNALQREYNNLVEKGAANSAHARQVLQSLNGAISQQQQDQTAANDSIRKAHGLHVEQAHDLQDKVASALGKSKDAQDAYNKSNARYQEDLKHMPRDINVFKNDEEQRNKTLKALNLTQDQYNKILQESSKAQAKLITDNINSKRVQAGMPLVLNDQAVAVGNLGKQIALLGGKNANKAFNFVVHTPNPADLVKISNLINGLNPKDKKAAITVLANTKDAAQALRELNKIQIKEQRVKVSADLGNVVAQIAKLQGIHLTPKMQHFLSTGGPGVIAEIAHVMGIKLSPKVLRLLGEAQSAINAHNQVAALRDIQKALKIIGDAGSALGAMSAVGSAIASLPGSKTITITTVHLDQYKSTGVRNRQAMGGVAGMPGATPSTALERMQERAALIAAGRSVEQTRGGMFNKPTYLVGEENRGEYVIATNPSYRRANLRYLGQAASALGARVVAAARGYVAPRGKKPTYDNPAGVTDTVTNDPDTYKTVGKGKKKHKVKVPGKPHHDRAYAGIPPADMIGGVGTADIDTQVSTTQQQVNTDTRYLKALRTRLAHDNRRIDHYKLVTHHRKLTDAEKSDRDQMLKDRDALNARRGASSISSHNRSLGKEINALSVYKGIQKTAGRYFSDFATLESDAANVLSLRDAAGTDPSDMAYGFDPTTHKYARLSWDAWNSRLSKLDHKHTDLLRTAFEDLRTRVGSRAFPKNAKNLAFVSALESAYGASVGTQVGVDQDTDPHDPAAPVDVPGKTKTIGDTTFNYPEALSDYLAYTGQAGELAWDELAVTAAAIAQQKAPGDPSAQAGVTTAAKQLSDFYGGVYAATQQWPNPVTGTQDPGLINEAGQAYLGALQNLTTSTPTGPTQGQLFGGALASLGATYGSNTLPILAAAANLSSGGLASALQGGASAGAALEGQTTSRVASATHAAPPAQAAQQQGGHTVNNYYKHMPEDPHTWSKGILWELNA